MHARALQPATQPVHQHVERSRLHLLLIAEDPLEQLRAGRVPLNAEALDHFGRVDFDDDEGTTIVTIYVERTLIGYMVHIDHLGDPTMLGVTIHQD